MLAPYFPASKPRPDWILRWVKFADLDYKEGIRRDAFFWSRYREPYWVRPALDGEYDGARRAQGGAVTEHRRALVIVGSDHGKLERFFLPVAYPVRPLPGLSEWPPQTLPALAEYLGASHWWQIATDAFIERPGSVMYDTQPIGADA